MGQVQEYHAEVIERPDRIIDLLGKMERRSDPAHAEENMDEAFSALFGDDEDDDGLG